MTTITADTSLTQLHFIEEVTQGVTPNSALKELRHTSNSLSNALTFVTSTEIRSDRQITDSILTNSEPSGDVGVELSYGAFDDLLEGGLFSDWSTDVAISATDISAASADNSYNSTVTNFSTSNLSVGQHIKVSGFATAGNNGIVKVVSLTATKLVVSGLTLVNEIAGVTVVMKGSMIRNGVTKHFYTLETKYSDITQFLTFKGCEVSKVSLNFATGAIVTGTFSFMGLSAVRGTSSAGNGSFTAAPTNDVLNSVSNVSNIKEAGSVMSGVYPLTLSLNVENNLRAQKALGVLGSVGIGSGTCNVTGNLEVYFVNGNLYDKLLNNTATSLEFTVSDVAGNTFIVTLPHVKFTGGAPTVSGINQNVVLNLSWHALMDSSLAYTIQVDKIAA